MEKVEKKHYLKCVRCKIDSNTEDRMIPCPRGGCDAEIYGETTIKTEVRLFDKEEFDKANE